MLRSDRRSSCIMLERTLQMSLLDEMSLIERRRQAQVEVPSASFHVELLADDRSGLLMDIASYLRCPGNHAAVQRGTGCCRSRRAMR